jgi:hypothetical protein
MKPPFHTSNSPRARRLAFSLLAVAASAATAGADELFVGSPTTAFARGNSTHGDFVLLGACGGQIHSMVADGSNLFFGDPLGHIYRFDGATQQLFYAYDAPNDAQALAVHGTELLVGGSDSTVARLNKASGALLGTWTTMAPVSELALLGNFVFAGTSFGIVNRAALSDGNFSFFGTCGGPVTSMCADATDLILGTANGDVYRVNLATQALDTQFHVASDATAMAIQGGSLLVGGSDGRVVRVQRLTGAVQGSVQWDFPISAMTLGVSSPGVASCFGSSCPCGNVDALGGCRNSTGVGSYLGGNGSSSVSADDLELTTFNLPPNSLGRLYMGAASMMTPFGDGNLCAGSGGYGQFRFPIQGAGPSGSFAFGPGIAAYGQSHFGALGQITPGFTWHFQGWYRNVQGPCGSGFNTTNTFSVTFTP